MTTLNFKSAASAILLAAAFALTGCATTKPPAAAPALTIFMAGDSTMADKPVIPAGAERGWGQLLPLYFAEGVRIDNHAANGRSSKSFIDEGRWKPIVERIKPGDFVIVQFGHNDEKIKSPDRYTVPDGSYRQNLEKFISETRERGGRPILCTSVSRRKFLPDGTIEHTHADYIRMTRVVAAEQKVPLLDLNKRTDEVMRRLGPEESKHWFMWVRTNEFPNLKKDSEDDTHFNAYGASRVCDLAVEEMKTSAPELARWLRPEANEKKQPGS